MDRFYRGASEQAVRGLVATWALLLGLTGAWVLPAMEPYRLSNIVTGPLQELVAKERAPLMLGAFQEASVIYAIGHPIPIMHERADLVEKVHHHGAIVSALTEPELKALKSDPRLSVDVRGTLRGFNPTKGKNVTLLLSVIRPQAPGSALAVQPQQAGIK
ncbi:MAG: hypothetical protein IRY99_15960 [Isosphaeraceae bacterium]|nr:hypothetical protein [Isosphaeraceae bacterium]